MFVCKMLDISSCRQIKELAIVRLELVSLVALGSKRAGQGKNDLCAESLL
jgi:hypothetical protein